MVRLSDVCDVRDGTHDSPKYVEYGYPLVTSKNIKDGQLDLSIVNFITEEDYNKINERSKVDVGDIIMPMIGTIGNPYLVEEFCDFAIKNVALIKCDNIKVINKFVWYFLQSNAFERYVDTKNKGGTQKFLSLGDIRAIELLEVSIDKQKHIVEILTRVDGIVAKRKQQLQKLDGLVKARFVEMFGDPISNSKNMEELPLNDLGELGRGVSKHRPRNAPELLGGEYPLIQTGDVANAELYIEDYNTTYSEIGLQQSKMWKAGTLCITIAANIAKTAILKFDACFPDSVVGFNANSKTNNIFMHYWFTFFQRILEAQAPESAQKNINLKILSELNVIVPPIELQSEFVEFVKQIDKSKLSVQKSLDKLETLKKALMQKYFG